MTPTQWQRVKELFAMVCEEPSEAQHAFLNHSCSDTTVRSEVERLLAEHRLVSGFLSRPATVSSSIIPVESSELQPEFLDTPRFKASERIGAGTFGVVYRTFDDERNSFVALKKLKLHHPAHLIRFKREFRSLVDLAHPNLVQLYELFNENQQWFFTMELIEGLDLLSFLRKERDNWDRLRDVMHQLAVAVEALHSSGWVHRDLKPSNVLVTEAGRVVVLDFGLAEELQGSFSEGSTLLAGSPAYMAPEQAARTTATEAADWYSVGVVLYQAMSGQLPFAGEWREILERKQRESAIRIREMVPHVPTDLDEACFSLLQLDPNQRTRGKEVLLSFGAGSSMAKAADPEYFVGREAELKALNERVASVSLERKRQVVLLQGQSGIGKTSLMSRFLIDIELVNPDAVILRGRCRESESLPFKALDPIADELVRHLHSLTPAARAALMPRDPELLRRLFPVFGELAFPETSPSGSYVEFDAQDLRRRTFDTLRGLLWRLAAEQLLVISIDDLQWGDLDSFALLSELILPANAPPLLLLLACRSEEMETNSLLKFVREFGEQLSAGGNWLNLEVGGLSVDEGRNLVALLPETGNSLPEEESSEILREAGGSPLLLAELLRFASRNHRTSLTDRRADGTLIAQMIRHRASALSSTARQLLEVLSIADEPLPKWTLYRAIATDQEDPAQVTRLLLREHLVRFTGGSRDAMLELFHDKVREASLSWLSPLELSDWHSRLAQLLQEDSKPNPQRLLRHYKGCGNMNAALKAALEAARASEDALAFEQAARFYAEALETGEADASSRARILRLRAQSLANAGRGHEAGECYLEAARFPEHNDAFDMHRSAAEQLIRSGHLEKGTGLFFALLKKTSVRVPTTRIETLLRMLAIRLFIRVRGLGWQERSEADTPYNVLRKMNLLWSGSMAMVSIDPISGSYLQALHMLAALRAGEPSRLSLSLAFAAVYEGLGGASDYEHGRRLISSAQELATRLNNPYYLAVTYGCWATLDFFSLRVVDGLAHCRVGLENLHRDSQARIWELGTFNLVLTWHLGWGGRIRELSEAFPLLAEEGRARGDIYTVVSLRCSGTSHLVELAADRPEGAMTEILESLKLWRKSSYDLPHLHATLAIVECLLYAGRVEEARRKIISDWPSIRWSLITRKSQIHKTMLFYLRGRTALAEWLLSSCDAMRVETEHFADRLTRLRCPWATAFSCLLRAGLNAGKLRHRQTICLLEQAEEIFRKHDLRLLAAATLRRRGELEGQVGECLINTADQFMSAERIARPDRMTAMILPGNWPRPNV